MKLIIDCTLSEPPSEISCFRDVTLYGKTYCFEDILLVCPKGTRTIYWEWLKSHGAHDYITYLLTYSEPEPGILMHPDDGDIRVPFIKADNLHHIISVLKGYIHYE